MQSNDNYRILIAEDDYLVCEEIKRSIKKIGCQYVGIATNGLQAVEMVKTLVPDVVLMDIQMPQMDGLTAAKEIQKIKSTPIVILTAHDASEFIHKAGEYGVGAFLTKPPKAEEIERSIIIAVERHKDFVKLEHLNQVLEKSLIKKETTEKELTKLLAEKELLLKEIHHRVKNNFMIISSLISLQTNQINDPKVKEMLQETYNRINSMSLVHEKLYQSDDLSSIDLNIYISNLVNNLIKSYTIDMNKISIRTDINKVNLDINRAIPVGLIINELITNAFKHAFPDSFNGKGEIFINISNTENQLIITIQDNGVGIPANFKIENSKSLGMRLVSLLVNNQLGGSIQLGNKNGTYVKILIPD